MKYRGFEEKAKSKMTKYPKIGLSEMIDSPNGLIKMSATSIYNDLTLSLDDYFTFMKIRKKKIENFEVLKK